MNSRVWFKLGVLGTFIAIMILAVLFYGYLQEIKFSKERTKYVEKVEAKETEATRAKNLQMEAETKTKIIREASADYEEKLKAHFEDSHEKIKQGFLENAHLMKDNYEAEMAKFKLQTTISVGGIGENKQVTVVLKDTTKAKAGRETEARTFYWSDAFLSAKVLVSGDSATIIDYTYAADLLFKVRSFPGSMTRVPYKIIDIETKNPHAVLKSEDRAILINDQPNILQKLFRDKQKKPTFK